jgi:hypothetical protein
VEEKQMGDAGPNPTQLGQGVQHLARHQVKAARFGAELNLSL